MLDDLHVRQTAIAAPDELVDDGHRVLRHHTLTAQGRQARRHVYKYKQSHVMACVGSVTTPTYIIRVQLITGLIK